MDYLSRCIEIYRVQQCTVTASTSLSVVRGGARHWIASWASAGCHAIGGRFQFWVMYRRVPRLASKRCIACVGAILSHQSPRAHMGRNGHCFQQSEEGGAHTSCAPPCEDRDEVPKNSSRRKAWSRCRPRTPSCCAQVGVRAAFSPARLWLALAAGGTTAPRSHGREPVGHPAFAPDFAIAHLPRSIEVYRRNDEQSLARPRSTKRVRNHREGLGKPSRRLRRRQWQPKAAHAGRRVALEPGMRRRLGIAGRA